MKRIVLFICALILALSACSCADPGKKSTASETRSEPARKTAGETQLIFDEADRLIAEGHNYEAALLLWVNKDFDGVLDRFVTVAERIPMKSVYTNVSGEKTVTQHGVDEQNYLVSEETTYTDGTFSAYIYTYENGLPVKVTFTSPDGSETLTELSYDQAGNRVRMTDTYSDGAVDLNEYSYDSAGRLLSQKTTQRDGFVILSTNEYDPLGRIVKETLSYSSGETSVWEHFYNGEDKKPCRDTYTDSDGSVTVTETAYDANLNPLTETVTYPDGETERTEYSYNASGKLKKSVRQTKEGDELTSTYEYDGSGNVVHALIAEDFGTMEHDYVYSSEGDLLKETVTYSNGDTEVYEYSNYMVILKRKYS